VKFDNACSQRKRLLRPTNLGWVGGLSFSLRPVIKHFRLARSHVRFVESRIWFRILHANAHRRKDKLCVYVRLPASISKNNVLIRNGIFKRIYKLSTKCGCNLFQFYLSGLFPLKWFGMSSLEEQPISNNGIFKNVFRN